MNVLLYVIFVAVYLLSGKLSLQLAQLNPSASPIWPPSGIALAVLFLYGIRYWPFVLVGAFLVNVSTTANAASSIGIAVGNTLEAVVGAYAVHRFAGGFHVFDRPRNVLLFAISAGVIGPAIAATIGVISLTLSGSVDWSQFFDIWFTWWLGDASGIWVVAPFIILWSKKSSVGIYLPRILEFFLVLFLLLGSCFIIFFSGILPYPYLTFPALFWAAVRFGPRGASLVLLILSSIAMWATIQNLGPFANNTISPNTSLLHLQLFVSVMAISELVMAAEVQQRKRAERNVVKRERLYRALIEKSTDAVTLINRHATVLYASPSSETILGYRPDELVGQNGMSLVFDEDFKKASEALGQTLAMPHKSQQTEVRLRKKDGTFIWIEATSRNMLHDESVGAIVVNFRDITERKKLEEGKNEFLMIAAHQLRAPLASMRWNLELLLKDTKKLPSSALEKLSRLSDQNQNLILLVNELLGVTRIIQGTIPNNPEEADLKQLIDKEIESLQSMAHQYDVSITVSVSGTKRTIMIDQRRFIEVIQNILSNALKYNTKGGTIDIHIAYKKNEIILHVTDTGIGIPKSEQRELFTKFFRTSNAKTVHAEGAGLGLFVVKSYVEHWGGSINIESPVKDNKGTRVTLVLPQQSIAVKKGGLS